MTIGGVTVAMCVVRLRERELPGAGGMCGLLWELLGVDSGSGTSSASPTFAGIVTHLNAARLAAGKPSVGFINPLLYSLAASNPEVFYDVTVGSNECGTWALSSVVRCGACFPSLLFTLAVPSPRRVHLLPWRWLQHRHWLGCCHGPGHCRRLRLAAQAGHGCGGVRRVWQGRGSCAPMCIGGVL